MTSYVWREVGVNEDGTPKNGWVEKPKRLSSTAPAGRVFQEVIAPDGTRIASSAQMQEFTTRTGMTNDLDSLRGQADNHRSRIAKTSTKKERVAAIRDSIERLSSSSYHRRVENYGK
ncbi:MAG: hypothetical protein HN738_10175 [Gammaproteobacteria bacterium]|jgi:hypothetical protein|nr:hypothetical protein [Gammaproteobacteria bacterium]|tara:strand:+ start:134 stop:484 length:351 start_codon:yes stop_codon:yes gene_type:complete